MQAKPSGAEFLSAISKFIKRKKILWLPACLRPSQNVKSSIFTWQSCSDGKEMYKKASCTCKVVVLPCQGALTICMENPVIPGRIQMERFIPVKIFRKKSNTLRGITFFPFLPIRPKYLVPFVWSVPGVSWGGKWFISTQAHSLSGVLQWYNSNSFVFSETFSSPVPFVRNFLPKFPYKW